MHIDDLQHLIVDALDDLKATNIVTIDVKDLSTVTDRMIIATGNSRRQVSSLAKYVQEKAKEAGVDTYGMEGEDAGEWVLVDFGDIVVHVMQSDVRHFYQLERLWSTPPLEEETRRVAESG